MAKLAFRTGSFAYKERMIKDQTLVGALFWYSYPGAYLTDAETAEKAGKRYDYTEVCKMLKKKGLLVDESYIRNGKPYEYGTAWLTCDIPDEDLTRIRKWMEI